MEQECNRRGFVWLNAPSGGHVIIATKCKTWSCRVCQRSLSALFRARVEIGVSRLGRCAFITATYKAEGREDLLADASAKDWRAFLRRLERSGQKPQAWMKVTELTKKKVPHHHILVGPVQGRIRCYSGDSFDVRTFRKRLDQGCNCLSHVWARAWFGVTGDSYIVHATPVISATGAGNYLEKYMGKSHLLRDALVDRGFIRRWSNSRTWPGGGRLRLWQTTHGGWEKQTFNAYRPSTSLIRTSSKRLLRRDGENLTLLMASKRNLRATVGRMKRMANVTTDSP